jgi:hypothetical protein
MIAAVGPSTTPRQIHAQTSETMPMIKEAIARPSVRRDA